MLWWPVLVVMADLPNAFPDSRFVSTVGLATLVFGLILYAQMALSYPTGRLLPGRLAWIYIFILGYLAQAIQNVVNMLFWDQRGCPVLPASARTDVPLRRFRAVLPRHVEQGLVDLHHGDPADRPLRPLPRLRNGKRRDAAVGRARDRDGDGDHLHVLGLPLLPRHRPVLGSPAALVGADLGRAGSSADRSARARCHETGARLGWRLRRRPRAVRSRAASGLRSRARSAIRPSSSPCGCLTSAHGQTRTATPIELPKTLDRAVTYVGDDLAAIVHDPVLLDQAELLEAAGSAAKLALENERLQAELRAQLRRASSVPRAHRAGERRGAPTTRARPPRRRAAAPARRGHGAPAAAGQGPPDPRRDRAPGRDRGRAPAGPPRAARPCARHPPGRARRSWARPRHPHAPRAHADTRRRRRDAGATARACGDGDLLRRGRGARERRPAMPRRRARGSRSSGGMGSPRSRSATTDEAAPRSTQPEPAFAAWPTVSAPSTARCRSTARPAAAHV